MPKQPRSTVFTTIVHWAYYLKEVPCSRSDILCKHRTYFHMLRNACKHTPPWETLERNMVVLYLETQLYTGTPAGIVLSIQQTAFANNLCKYNTCFYFPEKTKVPSPHLTGSHRRDSADKWLGTPLRPIPQAHIRPPPPRFIMPHQ